MGKGLKSFADWRLRENLREYDYYFNKYRQLLLSMFVWEGLPDGISARFIEEKLFDLGQVIFFKSKEMGFYVVSCATQIGFNCYGEPTSYRAYSIDGSINEIVHADDCIPIWNDIFRSGNADKVHFFAKRLSNIEKTIDVNLEQLKQPYIVACPEGQKISVEQFFKKKTNGEPYIFVSDDFNTMNSITVLQTGVQNYTKDLQDLKHLKESEALTTFGINNVNIAKRERLVSGEAEQNDEQIAINKNSMYQARINAVKQINEKFGLEISVSIDNSIIERWESEGNE